MSESLPPTNGQTPEARLLVVDDESRPAGVLYREDVLRAVCHHDRP